MVRLNAIASNLANADNIASSVEDAYKPIKPVFETKYFDIIKKNIEVILNLAVKFSPVTFFTSRSARKVLEQYKDTYFFPKRILESTPIEEKDIYQEFEIFYNELMRYADENYLLAEKTMGKQLSTTAFAKAGTLALLTFIPFFFRDFIASLTILVVKSISYSWSSAAAFSIALFCLPLNEFHVFFDIDR